MNNQTQIDIELSDIQIEGYPNINSISKQTKIPYLHQKETKSQKLNFKNSSKLRAVIRSKISGQSMNGSRYIKRNQSTKTSKHKGQCQICEQKKKIRPDLYIAECEHKNLYCESCLHQYAIYMVGQFQQVACPHSECDKLLSTEGKFFKGLPLDIQKKYKKIYKFHLTMKDSSIKMCPQQNCEGFIKKQDGQGQQQKCVLCSECGGKFCVSCLMKFHDGGCDSHQIDFLLQNLKYKRCRKCGMVIEKNQGCNQMTCRCKHQFCYVCGEDWAPIHYNPHDSAGRPLQGNNYQPQAQAQQAQQCRIACILVTIIRTILFIMVKVPLILLVGVIFVLTSILWSLLWISFGSCFLIICKYDIMTQIFIASLEVMTDWIIAIWRY